MNFPSPQNMHRSDPLLLKFLRISHQIKTLRLQPVHRVKHVEPGGPGGVNLTIHKWCYALRSCSWGIDDSQFPWLVHSHIWAHFLGAFLFLAKLVGFRCCLDSYLDLGLIWDFVLILQITPRKENERPMGETTVTTPSAWTLRMEEINYWRCS
jgi:hypothetical protein